MNLEELGLPLGKTVAQPDVFGPEHLAPVPRSWAREKEQVDLSQLSGVDVWNLWELSWLEPGGRPVQAVGRLTVPYDSPNLVESKSIKLYLNSMNNTQFESWDAVQAVLTEHVSNAAGKPVTIDLWPVGAGPLGDVLEVIGEVIDQADFEADYSLSDDIAAGDIERSTLISHSFRSLCPVTAQPDWATLVIDYEGPRLDRGKLLSYLTTFRNHQGFHEACCERMASELLVATEAKSLTIEARFLRRGGLDINPIRSTQSLALQNVRWSRQ